MTTDPPPSQAEIQKLLDNAMNCHLAAMNGSADNPETASAAFGAAMIIPNLLFYIRTLEKEHREMRSILEFSARVPSPKMSDHSAVEALQEIAGHWDFAESKMNEVLSSLTIHD